MGCLLGDLAFKLARREEVSIASVPPLDGRAARELAVRRGSELASELVAQCFAVPSRAVAFDDPHGAFEGVALGGIVADPDDHLVVEGTDGSGSGRFVAEDVPAERLAPPKLRQRRTRRSARRQFGGGLRSLAGVFAEIIVSALMAPVMMIFQSIAVEILAGRDADWQTQRRDDRTVARRKLYRKYRCPDLVRRCDGRKRLRRFAAASALDVAGHRWFAVRRAHRGADSQPRSADPDHAQHPAFKQRARFRRRD